MHFLRKSLSEKHITYYVTIIIFDIKGVKKGEEVKIFELFKFSSNSNGVFAKYSS